MGSVKDLEIIVKPSIDYPGEGIFNFSDRYSVFDWGEMPDNIKNKGAVIAMMSAWNFEKLNELGISTHYNGLMNPDKPGSRTGVDVISTPSNRMNVKLLNVYKPEINQLDGKTNYDYSFYQKTKGKLNHYLIPLEVVFRNGFPEGSSIFDRLKKGSLKPEDLGLKQAPKPFDMLDNPIYDFWTKLESSDRLLSEDEAFEISGMLRKEFQKIAYFREEANNVITNRAEDVGFEHFDGKIELGYSNGLMIVDVLGTFDENRLSYDGMQISKEVLRQYYKKQQPEWVSEWKEKKDLPDAREICKTQPMMLDPDFKELVSQMYMSGANKYIGREIFDSPPLEEVMPEILEFIK